MSKKLIDKVALVTAASRGIGRAIALKLASEGAKVVVNYVSSESSANEVVDAIKAMGTEAYTIKADVSKVEEVEAMFQNVMETYGKIDILVNNAGIIKDALIVRMSDEDFDAVINTNLKGVFYCCRAAAKIMMKQRIGNIVNISSVSPFKGNFGQANYNAAKGGVVSMSKGLARELGARNIRVNVVAPGLIETDMTKNLGEHADAILANAIIKRAGKPEDVANAVCFLASSDSDYITGQVIHVNGGTYL